jgi:cytochrome c2
LYSQALPRGSLLTRNSGLLLILQILTAAAIASISSLFLHSVIWKLPHDTLLQAVLFGASYLACASVLLWREKTADGMIGPAGAAAGRERTSGSIMLLLAAAYAPSLLILTLARADVPRRVILAELALGIALIWLTSLLHGSWVLRSTILAIAAVTGIAIQVPFALVRAQPAISARTQTWLVNTTLYPLKITEYQGWFAKPKVYGGGMTPVGDRYLLATGDGDMYLVAEAQGEQKLKVQHVPYRIPVNADEFTAAVGSKIDATSFRAADVLVQELEGKTRLFATHHFWKADQQCFVMRISMLESTDSAFLAGARPELAWKTIYESSPCIPIEFPGRPPHFSGIQIGGRLAMLSNHELLVTVGDHELDGFNSPLAAPQDPASSYGKTVLINLEDFSSRTFSLGHRNPQGLFVDQSGTIWLTEHGPQGGDELNLLERGANYGWPFDTYGVEYGTHTWPVNAVPGTHEQFTEPYYSWTPSIGVSSLLVSHSSLFKLWDGDLLVSSLRDKAIYHLRIRNSRVVMMERIAIGERIRDLNEGRDGELLLWTDSGALIVVRMDTDVGTGEAVFHACTGCHVIDNGEEHGFGPDLFHIVNRKVASAPGFNYSPALSSLGGRWTSERLDAFLANPQGFAPGTKMRFPGVPDAESRAKLIRYLSSSSNHPPQLH